jgi:hypothetical protein
MLLNDFLKEHRKVENRASRIQEQELTIARLEKQVEALAAGLQKVSDEIELGKFTTGRIRLRDGRMISVVDAQGDGKYFVVRAEKS